MSIPMEPTSVRCPHCGEFLVRIVYANELKCLTEDCGYSAKWDQEFNWNQEVEVTPGGLKMTRAAIAASIRKNCPGDDE
jgi:hypothetical protein